MPDYVHVKNTMKLLVSKKDGAQMLSISLRKLEYLIRDGYLPVRRIGRRTLIPVKQLEQFARQDIGE